MIDQERTPQEEALLDLFEKFKGRTVGDVYEAARANGIVSSEQDFIGIMQSWDAKGKIRPAKHDAGPRDGEAQIVF